MWQRFMPRTNALWLAALLWTLLRRFEQAAEHGSDGKGDDGGEEEREGLVLAGLKSLLNLLEGEEEKPGSAGAVVLAAMKGGLLQKRDWDAVRACLDGGADADADGVSVS